MTNSCFKVPRETNWLHLAYLKEAGVMCFSYVAQELVLDVGERRYKDLKKVCFMVMYDRETANGLKRSNKLLFQ